MMTKYQPGDVLVSHFPSAVHTQLRNSPISHLCFGRNFETYLDGSDGMLLKWLYIYADMRRYDEKRTKLIVVRALQAIGLYCLRAEDTPEDNVQDRFWYFEEWLKPNESHHTPSGIPDEDMLLLLGLKGA